MTYRVTADYFDRHLPGFDDALLAEADRTTGNDQNWPDVRRRYLQLPDLLPRQIYDQAKPFAGKGPCKGTGLEKLLIRKTFVMQQT